MEPPELRATESPAGKAIYHAQALVKELGKLGLSAALEPDPGPAVSVDGLKEFAASLHTVVEQLR